MTRLLPITRAVSPGIEHAHRIGLVRYRRTPDGCWEAKADAVQGASVMAHTKADARRGILVLAKFAKRPPDEVA